MSFTWYFSQRNPQLDLHTAFFSLTRDPLSWFASLFISCLSNFNWKHTTPWYVFWILGQHLACFWTFSPLLSSPPFLFKLVLERLVYWGWRTEDGWWWHSALCWTHVRISNFSPEDLHVKVFCFFVFFFLNLSLLQIIYDKLIVSKWFVYAGRQYLRDTIFELLPNC